MKNSFFFFAIFQGFYLKCLSHQYKSSSGTLPTDENITSFYQKATDSSFTCKGKKLDQYYGDRAYNCQIFHYCSENGNIYSFQCHSGLIFDKESTACINQIPYSCADSDKILENREPIAIPETVLNAFPDSMERSISFVDSYVLDADPSIEPLLHQGISKTRSRESNVDKVSARESRQIWNAPVGVDALAAFASLAYSNEPMESSASATERMDRFFHVAPRAINHGYNLNSRRNSQPSYTEIIARHLFGFDSHPRPRRKPYVPNFNKKERNHYPQPSIYQDHYQAIKSKQNANIDDHYYLFNDNKDLNRIYQPLPEHTTPAFKPSTLIEEKYNEFMPVTPIYAKNDEDFIPQQKEQPFSQINHNTNNFRSMQLLAPPPPVRIPDNDHNLPQREILIRNFPDYYATSYSNFSPAGSHKLKSRIENSHYRVAEDDFNSDGHKISSHRKEQYPPLSTNKPNISKHNFYSLTTSETPKFIFHNTFGNEKLNQENTIDRPLSPNDASLKAFATLFQSEKGHVQPLKLEPNPFSNLENYQPTEHTTYSNVQSNFYFAPEKDVDYSYDNKYHKNLINNLKNDHSDDYLFENHHQEISTNHGLQNVMSQPYQDDYENKNAKKTKKLQPIISGLERSKFDNKQLTENNTMSNIESFMSNYNDYLNSQTENVKLDDSKRYSEPSKKENETSFKHLPKLTPIRNVAEIYKPQSQPRLEQTKPSGLNENDKIHENKHSLNFERPSSPKRFPTLRTPNLRRRVPKFTTISPEASSFASVTTIRSNILVETESSDISEEATTLSAFQKRVQERLKILREKSASRFAQDVPKIPVDPPKISSLQDEKSSSAQNGKKYKESSEVRNTFSTQVHPGYNENKPHKGYRTRTQEDPDLLETENDRSNFAFKGLNNDKTQVEKRPQKNYSIGNENIREQSQQSNNDEERESTDFSSSKRRLNPQVRAKFQEFLKNRRTRVSSSRYRGTPEPNDSDKIGETAEEDIEMEIEEKGEISAKERLSLYKKRRDEAKKRLAERRRRLQANSSLKGNRRILHNRQEKDNVKSVSSEASIEVERREPTEQNGYPAFEPKKESVDAVMDGNTVYPIKAATETGRFRRKEAKSFLETEQDHMPSEKEDETLRKRKPVFNLDMISSKSVKEEKKNNEKVNGRRIESFTRVPFLSLTMATDSPALPIEKLLGFSSRR